jgi:hypothetical protein
VPSGSSSPKLARGSCRETSVRATSVAPRKRHTLFMSEPLPRHPARRYCERFERLDRTAQEVRLNIKELASAKLWAIGLYVALAGTLLYVVARGAKWI